MSKQESAERQRQEDDNVDVIHGTPTQFGLLYPEEDVMGVLADMDAGKRAVEELTQAGVPQDEVMLTPGDEFAQTMIHLKDDRGLIDKIMSTYKQEIDQLMDRYVALAKEGRVIIVVRAEDDERTELVGGILAKHNADLVHHYGEMSVRRLN